MNKEEFIKLGQDLATARQNVEDLSNKIGSSIRGTITHFINTAAELGKDFEYKHAAPQWLSHTHWHDFLFDIDGNGKDLEILFYYRDGELHSTEYYAIADWMFSNVAAEEFAKEYTAQIRVEIDKEKSIEKAKQIAELKEKLAALEGK
jgi:hypothetical protein